MSTETTEKAGVRLTRQDQKSSSAQGSSEHSQDNTPGLPASNANALQLLQHEAEVRRLETEPELIYYLANEARSVLGFRQAFLLQQRHGRFRVRAVSSMASVARDAPLIRWIERLVARLGADKGLDRIAIFTAAAYSSGDKGVLDEYPFNHLMWIPLTSRRKRTFAGLLVCRETPWQERSRTIAARLAECYAHAWLALTRAPLRSMSRKSVWTFRAISAVLLVVVAIIPVPITAIAPVEVVGQDARMVASPLEGTIDEFLVRANERVETGDVLFRIEDTELRNAAEIADQRVLLAEAKLEQIESGSFVDPAARREIAIAKSELRLAQLESDLAHERLSRTVVRAPASGIASFTSAQDWIGQPVSIGEVILEIADPRLVEFLVLLPVSDLIVLDQTTTVRVFLDSDPMHPIASDLRSTSYHAALQDDGTLAYELRAAPPEDLEPPRIGSLGAAQVMGRDAILIFVLLRRPFTWVRQHLGI